MQDMGVIEFMGKAREIEISEYRQQELCSQLLQATENAAGNACELSALQVEIDRASALLCKLQAVKNAYYEAGPFEVPRKYQNLVAVSMFYEYLVSRRCRELEGYLGVYNVYEQDLQFAAVMGPENRDCGRLAEYAMCREAVLETAERISGEVRELMQAWEDGRMHALEDGGMHALEDGRMHALDVEKTAAYCRQVSAACDTYRGWIHK